MSWENLFKKINFKTEQLVTWLVNTPNLMTSKI